MKSCSLINRRSGCTRSEHLIIISNFVSLSLIFDEHSLSIGNVSNTSDSLWIGSRQGHGFPKGADQWQVVFIKNDADGAVGVYALVKGKFL